MGQGADTLAGPIAFSQEPLLARLWPEPGAWEWEPGPVSPGPAPRAAWRQLLPPGAAQGPGLPGLRGAELGGAPPAPCPTVTLPPQDAIAKAVSRVCSKVKGVLRGLCKRIMRKSLQRVASDIMAGKEPRAICVDVRMCRARAGECSGDSRAGS